jgi:hypothetical protein
MLASLEPLYRQILTEAKKQFGVEDPRTVGVQLLLSMNLLLQHKYSEAETLLRECLAVREKKQPDVWSTFNSKSMLGAALLGQKKYAAAEPLLLNGYEGMKKREAKMPREAKIRLTEALERLVQLYEAMNDKDKVTKWRKQLEAAKVPAKRLTNP